MMTTMIHRTLAAPFITAPPVRIRPNSVIYIYIYFFWSTRPSPHHFSPYRRQGDAQIVICIYIFFYICLYLYIYLCIYLYFIYRALAAPFITAPPVRICQPITALGYFLKNVFHLGIFSGTQKLRVHITRKL